MKKFFFVILVTALFLSCKKEDKTCDLGDLNMTSMAGTWRVTAVRYKASASSTEQDYYNQYFTDACERDDNVVLNSNGTYVFNDAGIECVPSGDDTGTWSVSGNQITVDGSASTVESYNCSTFTVSEPDVFITGDRLTLVFTRQ